VIRRVRVDRYVVLIVVVVFATACSESLQHPDRDPQTEELVRQYLTDNPGFLLDNPEFLAGVRAVAQAREERRQALARRALLDARASVVIDAELTPAIGPADASVTIIEFSDYQCVPCKASYPGLAAVAASDSDLRFVHKQLPVYGSHSVLAARAAVAAHRQGGFAAFHHELMTGTLPLTAELVYGMAGDLGLDVDVLRADMRDPVVIEYLSAVRRLAEQLDIDSTPTFIVGDRLVRGGLDAELLREILVEQRAALD
jgi:protein-disulfide isomerase